MDFIDLLIKPLIWLLVPVYGILLSGLSACIGYAQQAHSCTDHAVLSPYERTQFVAGYYGERKEVYVQLLATRGCEKAVLASLTEVYGTLRFSDEPTGYALVLLPKEKLLEILDLPGIAYAFPSTDSRNYSEPQTFDNQRVKLGAVAPVSIPTARVATELPNDGPHFAAHEIGLDKLWQEHPEADGRGVTAAILDSGLDLLHPAMQQSRDADTKIVPKIADQIAYTTLGEDENWVGLGDPIKTHDSSFEAEGRTWTAPGDGVYRFGLFRRQLVLGQPGNSHSKKLSLTVGVLLDESGSRAWVDTNGDGSFKDQHVLADFAVAHDIDWFGTKEGLDDNRIPFGVKIDATRNAVYVTIAGEGGHGASVAGSLAANRLTGGLYDGAAPSAQLIDARDSRLMQLTAILQLAAKQEVDVISRSGGIARAGYEGSREGIEDFQRHVIERMIEVYDKPMACVCVADGLIGVDDYVSAEMLRRNRQASPPYFEAVHSSYGASRSWGLVNSVLAPSAQLNTESRYMPGGVVFEDGKRHTFTDDRLDSPAPAGYWIGANESPTVPVVSGVIADLISEAKREHIRYSTARLDQAIFASAKLLSGIPTYEQGYGLIQADAAWAQLGNMAKVDDPANAELTSFTVTDIRDGHIEPIDGYYHEVSKPSVSLVAEIWVTRHGGYAGGRPYSFALRGDDGTYTLLSAKSTLVQNEPSKIRFSAKGTPGFHVAFVELVDQKTGTVMGQVPLSLKVPDTPQSVAPGVDRYTATMAPRRDDTRLIYLGKDVQAFRSEMQIPYEGPEFTSGRYMPGFSNGGAKAPTGGPLDSAHHVGPMEPFESLTSNSKAGFQYVLWENRAFHAEYETPYDPPAPTVSITGTVTVTKYAIGFSKDSVGRLKGINRLAPITGKVELYDATLIADTLTGTDSHGSVDWKHILPADLSHWRIRVAVDGGLRQPVDAFLLNCTGKNGCYVAAEQEISTSGTILSVNKPQAGIWRVVIRGRDQVSGSPVYRLNEAELVPTHGNTELSDTQHKTGETWITALPSTTRYAAFRIAGTPGVSREKNGLLIGMTPMASDLP